MSPSKASTAALAEKPVTKARILELLQTVENGDLEAAQEAARVLGEIADVSVIEPLVALLKRSSAARNAALAALRKIGTISDEASVELALAFLKEKGDDMRLDTPAPSGSPADRRRSPRVLLEIPVEVDWRDSKAVRHREYTRTKVVNAHGALLSLRTPVATKQPLHITNITTKSRAQARVAWVGDPTPEGVVPVGIELESPDPEFWVGKSHWPAAAEASGD